jgi:hypothetical protein
MKRLLPILDVLLLPFVYLTGLLLKRVRVAGFHRLPWSRRVLLRLGVVPISDHYYEPFFNPAHLQRSLSQERDLPGIDWNVQTQLELLNNFHYNEELDFLSSSAQGLTFSFDNDTFLSGDAEYWYSIIRHYKPKRIFEVGSGNSTLVAAEAIKRNAEEDPNYHCRHVCIEPYEMPWLEQLAVEVLRQKVEDVPLQFFTQLETNDILFIDSSHVIRPQGDVLFEYLQVLPSLKVGVIVHVHDIFTPRDYLERWVQAEVKFWNEQYLLEAFLTSNHDWQILAALNYLHHHYYDALQPKCPYLTPDREPGSFYMVRVQ